MNLLFVCKHNRFRSKVAEQIFKQLNKNKSIKVKSAGSNPDYYPVAENVQKALKELGYKSVNKHPKKISKELANWADKIIVVANNVKIENKKVRYWKISDTSQDNFTGIQRRVKDIEKRVKKLINQLK